MALGDPGASQLFTTGVSSIGSGVSNIFSGIATTGQCLLCPPKADIWRVTFDISASFAAAAGLDVQTVNGAPSLVSYQSLPPTPPRGTS